MDSQNIFDLFGRQENDNINSKIETYLSKFDKGFKAHVKETKNLLKAIGISKNYISANSKRIVNVKPSINDYDVVIKSELNEVLNAIITVGVDHLTTQKDLIDVVDYLGNLGKYVENLEERLETELKILFNGINEQIKKIPHQ